ncbi:nuclear transport factor 2 family protein [Novosphingobium sp.]|uniref:nuclear transport factor 2 family protein n=1 Tax=Novosphingobium sp. TaxID=1874826 RepID=UPI003340A08F
MTGATKRTLVALALLLPAPVAMGMGAGDSVNDPALAADQAAIATAERDWGMVFVTGDRQMADRLLDDAFVGIDSTGQVYGKKSTLAGLVTGALNSANQVGPITMHFYGDTAIAQARELQTGPAPEFKPMYRIFTDTWVRRAGQWRLVAAEDQNPGAPTPAAFRADEAQIIAARGASNRAIAAHDMAAFVPFFAEDAVFVWSNGSSAIGRAGLTAAFAGDFADPAFVAYIRTPERVSVAQTGARAAEHGTWTAIKREPRGETRYGGDYAAHWVRSAGGWHVVGELYVKLHCTGPLCVP